MEPSITKDWYNFDEGKTLGKKGSERGTIIADLENINGARITVEKDTENAPYAITFGIYGLMFHTHFKSGPEEVELYLHWVKSTMYKVFVLYDQDEKSRSDEWYHEHDRLVHELTID
jgi:hypothetical protein